MRTESLKKRRYNAASQRIKVVAMVTHMAFIKCSLGSNTRSGSLLFKYAQGKSCNGPHWADGETEAQKLSPRSECRELLDTLGLFTFGVIAVTVNMATSSGGFMRWDTPGLISSQMVDHCQMLYNLGMTVLKTIT